MQKKKYGKRSWKVIAIVIIVIIGVNIAVVLYLNQRNQKKELRIRTEIISDGRWSGEIYGPIGAGKSVINDGEGNKTLTWIKKVNPDWHAEVCYVELRRKSGYLLVEVYVNDKLIASRGCGNDNTLTLSAYI